VGGDSVFGRSAEVQHCEPKMSSAGKRFQLTWNHLHVSNKLLFEAGGGQKKAVDKKKKKATAFAPKKSGTKGKKSFKGASAKSGKL
jgi:hypothetical protein